jgi:hypothetical protein
MGNQLSFITLLTGFTDPILRKYYESPYYFRIEDILELLVSTIKHKANENYV